MSTPKHTFVGSTLLLFLGPNIRLSPPTLLGTRQCLGHPHFPLQAVPPTPPHHPPVPNTFHPPGRPTPSLLRPPSSSLQQPLSRSPLSSLLLSGHTLPPCPGAPRRTSPLSRPASPAHLRSLHPARQASAQGLSCPPTHVLCPHPGTPSPAGMAWAFFTARAAGPPRHRAPGPLSKATFPAPGLSALPSTPQLSSGHSRPPKPTRPSPPCPWLVVCPLLSREDTPQALLLQCTPSPYVRPAPPPGPRRHPHHLGGLTPPAWV